MSRGALAPFDRAWATALSSSGLAIALPACVSLPNEVSDRQTQYAAAHLCEQLLAHIGPEFISVEEVQQLRKSEARQRVL